MREARRDKDLPDDPDPTLSPHRGEQAQRGERPECDADPGIYCTGTPSHIPAYESVRNRQVRDDTLQLVATALRLLRSVGREGTVILQCGSDLAHYITSASQWPALNVQRMPAALFSRMRSPGSAAQAACVVRPHRTPASDGCVVAIDEVAVGGPLLGAEADGADPAEVTEYLSKYAGALICQVSACGELTFDYDGCSMSASRGCTEEELLQSICALLVREVVPPSPGRAADGVSGERFDISRFGELYQKAQQGRLPASKELQMPADPRYLFEVANCYGKLTEGLAGRGLDSFEQQQRQCEETAEDLRALLAEAESRSGLLARNTLQLQCLVYIAGVYSTLSKIALGWEEVPSKKLLNIAKRCSDLESECIAQAARIHCKYLILEPMAEGDFMLARAVFVKRRISLLRHGAKDALGVLRVHGLREGQTLRDLVDETYDASRWFFLQCEQEQDAHNIAVSKAGLGRECPYACEECVLRFEAALPRGELPPIHGLQTRVDAVQQWLQQRRARPGPEPRLACTLCTTRG